MDGGPGTLALVGGGQWTDGCTFDAGLLAASGGDEVLVLPTAAAYERPEKTVLAAAEWFDHLGGKVEGLMVLGRADAEDDGAAEVARRARFIYVSSGSPLHLRSVLKGSKVWAALVEAWRGGAVVAGSGAGAMVLTDPMVDPRGGALTVGLGLLDHLAVVPYFGDTHEDAHGEKLHRSVALAPAGLPVAGIPERTALIRRPDGSWATDGVGPVAVFVDGARAPDGVGALSR
ncbi:MAG TPA: Type 1 glutamine amidotransferase-like domain-containing protein [Acidimicrobiales bacterium]|nr:Type 1 glutamine amidotransferase-like domain-containing protein [Acidimicrobiales bacterium]